MKEVLAAIERRKTRLAQQSFLKRLESGEATLAEGQHFAAALTFWVMGFQDALRMNRSRVRSEPFVTIVEHHLEEDSGHEQWFWRDAAQLSALRPVEWYFGGAAARVRQLTFEIVSEVFRAESDAARLAFLLALEGSGEEFFSRVVGYFQRTEVADRLAYFAQSHRTVEREHEMFEREVHETLTTVAVGPAEREECLGVVERIFSSFERMSVALEEGLQAAFGSRAPSAVASYLGGLADRGIVVLVGAAAEPFASDFGRLESASVSAAIEPRTEAEVAFAVQLANECGVKLTIRTGGNSQAGQSLPIGEVTLALGKLDHLELNPKARVARCGPSCTWREVVSASLKHDLIPPVVPLNLNLPVGGTLGSGGLGTTSHRMGIAAEHVAAVRATSGAGGALSGPEAAEAFLANQGRCAVATQIELRLEPAAQELRTFGLAYPDLADLLLDMQRLTEEGLAEHMEALLSASFLGLRPGKETFVPLRRWQPTLHLALARGRLPADLRAEEVLYEEPTNLWAYLNRHEPRFDFMRRSGAWDQAHPWMEWILPEADAAQSIEMALSSLPPFFGDGHRVFVLPARRYAPFFALPEGDRFVGFAVLPVGIAREQLPLALAAAARVDAALRSRGAKRYLSGWLGDTDTEYWRGHFGDLYEAWLEAKARHDPQGTFASRRFPAAREKATPDER